MFVTRSSKPSRSHLEWRVRLFGMGAIMAVVGMGAEQPWLIDVAIALLVVGFLLRMLARRGILCEEEEDEPT
jgi:hypothetical protein